MKHRINTNIGEAFKKFFVIKDIKASISKPQAIQDNLKRKKIETPYEINHKPKKIKLEHGKHDQSKESKSKVSHDSTEKFILQDQKNLQIHQIKNNSSNNQQSFECKLCEKKFFDK